MRIIKAGEIQPKREITETCSQCKTEFAYTSDDVTPDRDGAYVECPVCKTFIASSL